MLETAMIEERRQEALEKIQNSVRNTKVIITKYLNDYVKGEYDIITTLSSTAEILKIVGEQINQHIQPIEKKGV